MDWNISDVAKLGSNIVIVVLFLAYLLKMQRESRAEREVERKTLTDLIANDLHHVTGGLETVNRSLVQTTESLKVVVGELKRR